MSLLTGSTIQKYDEDFLAYFLLELLSLITNWPWSSWARPRSSWARRRLFLSWVNLPGSGHCHQLPHCFQPFGPWSAHERVGCWRWSKTALVIDVIDYILVSSTAQQPSRYRMDCCLSAVALVLPFVQCCLRSQTMDCRHREQSFQVFFCPVNVWASQHHSLQYSN